MRQLLTCRCAFQRDVAALDAKYTKELADAKAENDARVMMLPLVVVGCTSKQSVSQCVATTASKVQIMQPPPRLADTAERDYFTLREADHYAKTTGSEPRSILMSSADRAAHIDGNSCNYCEQYTRASSGV